MRQVVTEINNYVERLTRDQMLPEAVERRHMITALVGLSISYRLPLPSGEVTRPEEWFIINCLKATEEVIGQINEHVVVSVDEAMKVVKSLWLMRYRIVHQPMSEEAQKACNVVLGSKNDHVADVYAESIRTIYDNHGFGILTTLLGHVGTQLQSGE